MAVGKSSISRPAASENGQRNKHKTHVVNNKSPIQEATRNLPNQSKRRSKLSSQNMIRQIPSDIMIDVLAALEGLDISISGAASLSADRPSYLTSSTLTERWQVDLDTQLNEFLGGEVAAEEYGRQLQVMLQDVEKLERMRDLMQSRVVDGQALAAVNGRCREIDEMFEGLEKRLVVSNKSV